MKKPLRIAVTGAAGNISYTLLFKLAAGEFLGIDQPIALQLVDIPQGMKALKGVAMELLDCGFPLLAEISLHDNPEEGFKDIDYAFLVGSRPRGPGMERADLMAANAEIFARQGKALNDFANPAVRVLVVGNPCNTNALIAQRNAPDLDPSQFTAMTRLDHNRTIGQLGQKLGVNPMGLTGLVVWGNHSPTMYPGLENAEALGMDVLDQIEDDWYKNTMIPTVQKRGAEIIGARGASSAASAAQAALDHMRDWALGSDDIVSMAVYSDGSYNVPEGLIFSFPCICQFGNWKIVQGMELSDFGVAAVQANVDELQGEMDMVKHLLPEPKPAQVKNELFLKADRLL